MLRCVSLPTFIQPANMSLYQLCGLSSRWLECFRLVLNGTLCIFSLPDTSLHFVRENCSFVFLERTRVYTTRLCSPPQRSYLGESEREREPCTLPPPSTCPSSITPLLRCGKNGLHKLASARAGGDPFAARYGRVTSRGKCLMFFLLSFFLLGIYFSFFRYVCLLSNAATCTVRLFLLPTRPAQVRKCNHRPTRAGRAEGLCVVGMAIGQLTTLDCHDAIFRTWALLRNTLLSRAAARYHPRSNIHSEGVGGGPPSPAHLPLELPPGDPRRERSIGPISRCLLSKFSRPSAT